MKFFKIGTLLISLFVVAIVGFIYSGIYPMGADVPHNKVTFWMFETLRERSIARASNNIAVPANLKSSERLLQGGADYNDMCVSCHLKPGKSKSDFSIGLYPTPPNLSLSKDSHDHNHESDKDKWLARQFWIIKHGVKASGMPAWGPTHSDDRIWSMVAFLQRLPELTQDQYQIITAREDGAAHH